MASVYEVGRGTQIFGPYTSAQLKDMAAQGRLLPDDLIRKQGTEAWNPATRYDGLFPGAASTPPGAGTKLSYPDLPSIPTRPAPIPTLPPPAAPRGPEVATPVPDQAPALNLKTDDVDPATLHPVAAASPPPARAPGSIAAWAAPVAAAMALAGVLSLLKPTIGPLGLLLVVGGLGLLVGLAVGFLRMTASTLARVDPAHPAAAESRARSRRVGLAGMAAMAPLGLLAMAEFATPEEGLVRSLVMGSRPEPVVEPVAEPAPDSVAPGPWASADFVMLGPDATAVALRYDAASAHFHILGRESGPRAVEAQRIAWDRGVQIIDEDPELAKRLHGLPEDGVISGRLETELRGLWRVHQYLPREAPLVAFHDLRRGVRRVGFVSERQPDAISFVPLNPRLDRRPGPGEPAAFAAETIRKQDVRPASHRFDFNEEQLEETADFLDYCVYKVLDGLSADPTEARYIHVAVAPARYDSIKLRDLKHRAEGMRQEYLAELSIKAQGGVLNESGQRTRDFQGQGRRLTQGSAQRNRQAQSGSFGEFGQSTSGDYGSETTSGYSSENGFGVETETVDYIESELREVQTQEVDTFLTRREVDGDREAKALLREIQQEQARLEDQKAEASKITSELRARLLAAGVSVVEREQLAAIEAERELWARSDFESAASQKLLGASHILLTEVRDRRGAGEYHLTTRLIDVRNGRIVVEKEGERTPPERVAAEPPVDTPFVLMSGQPVLIEFTPEVRPSTGRALASYPGGLPLRLPPIQLLPMTDEDRKLDAERLRLIKIFGQIAPGQVQAAPNPRGVLGRPSQRPIPGHLARRMGDMPPVPDGMHTRIGFLDDLRAPGRDQGAYRAVLHADLADPAVRGGLAFSALPYRDLFGEEIQDVPLDGIARIQPLGAESDSIPGAHHLRYATFRVAASVLPQAGRVTRTAGGILTVSLGHRNGLQSSGRLHVHRPGEHGRLEVELGVREIRDEAATVSYNPDEYLFPERYEPNIGDIVYPRPDRPIAVGFAAPEGTGDAGELAGQVVDSLRSALRSLNVAVVDDAGASHLVQVSVGEPAPMVVDGRRTRYPVYPMNIKVVDQGSRSVVTNISLDIEEPQALSWDL